MERAFVSARPRNKQHRRVFRVVGCAIIVGCIIAISLISSYSKNGYVTSKAQDEFLLQNPQIHETASEFLSNFDSDECEEGIPDDIQLTVEEKCRFFSEVCPSDRLIDYSKFRYCVLGENTVAVVFGIILLVVWLLTLFYMLSQAAESHFCPMLSEISCALRMSPDLAGMSILAFGNGAPDVFSSIAAFQQRNVGVLVGEMTGAGAFITHVIVGAIGVTSKVTLRRYPFFRDLCCYIFGLAFVLGLLIDNWLHLWEAIMFLVFYFCYLGLAIVVHVVEMKKGNASVVGKHTGKNETAPLIQNEVVVEAGEATLVDPDYGTFVPGGGRRRRAMSVHVSEINDSDSGFLSVNTTTTTTGSTPDAAILTTTTTTTTERQPRGMERKQAPRGRSSSPNMKLDDNDAAALRKEFEEMKKEEEQEQEDEELDLPSADYSLQAGDNTRAPSGKQAAQKRLMSERKTRELKALSELRSVASSAATVFMPKYSYDTQRRRFDDIEVLRAKQRHMFRNGILTVVQDWKEGGELVIPENITDKTPAEQKEKEPEELMQSEPSVLQRFKSFIQWDDMSKFGQVLYVLMLPISLLMYITVPHPEDEAYNKWVLAVATALSPLTIFWAFNLFLEENIWIALAVVLPVFVIFGILVAIFAKPEGLPRGLQFVFIFWGFVSSMMWIYYTADEVVALLQALAEMIGVSSTIMGLTVLAWGNCIGDFVADMTVSNQGYPEMGIAATYGGPLFNLLIGMGLGGTIASIEEGKVPCALNDIMLVDFAYLLTALIICVFVIPIRRFKVDTPLGIFLLGGYIIFLVLSFLIEFGVFHILPEPGSSSSSDDYSSSSFSATLFS